VRDMEQSQPSDEHEKRWVEVLADLGGGTPNDLGNSIYSNPSPGRKKYYPKVQARQTEEEYLRSPLEDPDPARVGRRRVPSLRDGYSTAPRGLRVGWRHLRSSRGHRSRISDVG